MELAALQRQLAQAYLDPDVNSTPLVDLTVAELRSFNASLRRKRAAIVGQLLPLTSAALGDSFDELFAEHARVTDLRGLRPYLNDALSFCAIVQHPAARYEAAWLEARQAGRRLTVRIFWRPRLSLVLWLRLTPNGRLRQLELRREAVAFGE